MLKEKEEKRKETEKVYSERWRKKCFKFCHHQDWTYFGTESVKSCKSYRASCDNFFFFIFYKKCFEVYISPQKKSKHQIRLYNQMFPLFANSKRAFNFVRKNSDLCKNYKKVVFSFLSFCQKESCCGILNYSLGVFLFDV